MSKENYEKAIVIGHVVYATKSQRTREICFTLGKIDHVAIAWLDFENILKILNSKFEDYQRNKVVYTIKQMFIRVWTDGNTFKEYIFKEGE